MKKQNYYVLWSGGLDSTYLIHKLLNDGHSVSAGYCEITNNSTKVVREKSAIGRLLPFFKSFKNFKFDVGGDTKISVNGNSIMTSLKQFPAWMTSILYQAGQENIDKIAIGYVMNDDAISYIPDMEKIYMAYKPLSGIKRWPKLVFPLKSTHKGNMIKELPDEMVNIVTFCEGNHLTDNCGECIPCKRWKRLEEDGIVPIPLRRFSSNEIDEEECEEKAEVKVKKRRKKK